MFVLLAIACAPTPEPAPAPAPVASIGGEPILHQPVVIGGIGTEAVQAALQPVVGACTEPGLQGKVLVKLTIDAEGAVSEASVRSTSLRHAPTEACLVAEVRKARFPPLQIGRLAIVHYPFVFGPG